ncbi:hypothetical protein ACHAXS_005841 [Conticribra weissflogii]
MFLTKREKRDHDDDDDSKESLTNSTTSCSSDHDKDAVISQMQSQLASHLEMINQLQFQLAHKDETISRLETQLVDMAMDLANSKAARDQLVLKCNLNASFTSATTTTTSTSTSTNASTTTTADKATNTAIETRDAATSTSSHPHEVQDGKPAGGSQASMVLDRVQNARRGHYRRASVDPDYGQHLLPSAGRSRRSTDPGNERMHRNRDTRGCDDDGDDDDDDKSRTNTIAHWAFPQTHKLHHHQHQHQHQDHQHQSNDHDDRSHHQGRNTYHGKSTERDQALECRRKLAMSLTQLKWGAFKSFRVRHGSDGGNASLDSASTGGSEGRHRERGSKDVRRDVAAGDDGDGKSHDRQTDTEAWKNQSSSSFMSTVVFPESFDDYLNDA